MLAVGAIGLGALGLLLFGPKEQPGEENPPSPLPFPPVVPPPTPPEPAPIIRPTALSYLSSPATLITGTRYRAIVQISPLEAMIPFVDARTEVSKRFLSLGFADVRVYQHLNELPFDWPSETLVGTTEDGRTFFVEGVWTKPTTTASLPPQVTKAWTSGVV